MRNLVCALIALFIVVGMSGCQTITVPPPKRKSDIPTIPPPPPVIIGTKTTICYRHLPEAVQESVTSDMIKFPGVIDIGQVTTTSTQLCYQLQYNGEIEVLVTLLDNELHSLTDKPYKVSTKFTSNTAYFVFNLPPKLPIVEDSSAHLAICENHFKSGRLTTGASGNALDCYSKVLKKDPGNETAQTGLSKIAERYITWATAAVEKQEYNNATQYLERLARVAPEHLKLIELGAVIKVAVADSEEKQRKQAEREAEEEKLRIEAAVRAAEEEKLRIEAAVRAAEEEKLLKEIERAAADEKLRIEIERAEEEKLRIEIERAKKVVAQTPTGEEAASTVEQKDTAEEPPPVNPDFPAPQTVQIKGGCFPMGSPETEESRDNDEYLHYICVEKDFFMGKYELTFDEYDQFIQDTKGKSPSDWSWGRENRPVINVSWDDAMAYTQWLSKKTGRSYRLPTEAEWEYAARAGSETKYPWGEKILHNLANCDGCKTRWDDLHQTAPVGSFPSNLWRLYDMAGNVWEWTCSVYDDSYSGSETRCADPSNNPRVIRGGSWKDEPSGIRSAYRNGNSPDEKSNDLGFRVVYD